MSAEETTVENGQRIHFLKCWPESFDAIQAGTKKHDIRGNDRNFRAGDWLRLCKFDPHTERYLGPRLDVVVTFITPPTTLNLMFGIKRSLVIMSVEPVKQPEKAPSKWTCAANAPQADCNWPLCNCDPAAERVVNALVESGWGPK